MKITLPDRLLRRQLGDRSQYASVRGLYGDRAWIDDLDIISELGGHSGCVNALCWSRSGRLLASGSDDQFVNIHSYLPEATTAPFKLTTSISTGHTANIFSVKFMPHSDDRILVTCAGDGDVRVFDVEYSGSGSSSIPSDQAYAGRRRGFNTVYNGVHFLGESDTNARVYRSHSDPVKRIVTESSPHLFLTCSEDGEVRQWDLRQPSSAYPPPRGGKGFMRTRRGGHHDTSNVPPPLISYARYHLDLNTISCSASQPHYIALGGAHLHCFLHDRRMLGRDVIRERGVPSSPLGRSGRQEELMDQATRCVRRFAPKGTTKMKRRDNGHITACKISDANPNEMIVSWSGDWIYSFDLIRSPAEETSEGEGREGFSKGKSDARVKESRNRKRKRGKPGSGSSTEERRPSSRLRRERSETASERDLALRVRYQNGQSEEIRFESSEEGRGGPSEQVERTQRLRYSRRIYHVAHMFVKLRQEIFGLQSSNRMSESTQVVRQSDASASFTAGLGYAASILPVMSEIMRTWRYPENPTEEEVTLQRTLRRNRESAYRFVQAAGTAARVLGGRLQTAGRGEGSAMGYFRQITPAPNETNPLDRSTLFAYEFIRAILAWLEGGLEGLLRAFKRTPQTRRDSRRYPIPDEAGLEAIEEILIPYLHRLTSETRIPNVDQTGPEFAVFETEDAAVTAFSNAIRIPFRDSPSEGGAGTIAENREGGGARDVQDRQTAIKFWAHKVARGVLMNAGEGLNFSFFLNAFGGLDFDYAEEESNHGGDDAEGEAIEEVLKRRPIDVEQSRGAASEGHAVEGSHLQGASNETGQHQEPSLLLNQHATVSDALNDEEMATVEEPREEDGEDNDDSDAEEEDEDDDNDDDDDDDDEGRQFVFASAFDRSRMREKVETNVPCSSHTRVYRGHCNVETVKDVNFFGLHDEYVVSGSDSGHLFIWDKKTSQLVNILEGDSEVVNVIQGGSNRDIILFTFDIKSDSGHPYEPMMAVSGIDHTLKIFSPDQRLQDDARNGINVSPGGSSGFSALELGGRTRFGRRRPGRPTTTNNDGEEHANTETQEKSTGGDDDDEDNPMRPPAEGGLASRRRMHNSYEILAQNDAERQGGMREAQITRGMLARIAAHLRERGAGGDAGGVVFATGGGEVEGLVLDENCQMM
ncbi:MAG: hypothetical protein M1816_006995 [Peltula sp. TS41687]|nr:MAG: hypothetical protein M1816_006995 [Peltula sp. TS41687]